MSLFRGKKNRTRIILFFIAVAVAVTAITYGVVNLGHKDEGYYAVELTPESRVVVYDSHITFMLYADGNSNQIKRTLNEASVAYSRALERCYKLLDTDTEYDGYVNLATLNHHPGTEYEVSEELYHVLTDALTKANAREGYSVFGGALDREWRGILYLENPVDFDPDTDPSVAARLRAIAQAASAEDACTLDISNDGARKVTFRVSDAYARFVRENEIDAPALSVNALKDAYLIGLVADAMVADGFDSGYLYANSGISVMLNRDDSNYTLYGCADKTVSAAATVPATSNSVCCQLTAFPQTENMYGYYALQADGRTVYRHPWINAATGACESLVMSAFAMSESASPADVAYALLAVYRAKDETEAKSVMQTLDMPVVAYTLQSSPSVLRVSGETPGVLTMNTETHYTKSEF